MTRPAEKALAGRPECLGGVHGVDSPSSTNRKGEANA